MLVHIHSFPVCWVTRCVRDSLTSISLSISASEKEWQKFSHAKHSGKNVFYYFPLQEKKVNMPSVQIHWIFEKPFIPFIECLPCSMPCWNRSCTHNSFPSPMGLGYKNASSSRVPKAGVCNMQILLFSSLSLAKAAEISDQRTHNSSLIREWGKRRNSSRPLQISPPRLNKKCTVSAYPKFENIIHFFCAKYFLLMFSAGESTHLLFPYNKYISHYNKEGGTVARGIGTHWKRGDL